MQKPYTSFVCLEVVAAGQKKGWSAEKVLTKIHRKLRDSSPTEVQEKITQMTAEAWIQAPEPEANGTFKITRRGKLELEVLTDRYRDLRHQRRNRVFMICGLAISAVLLAVTIWLLWK